jgi:hypothetical protein
MKPLSAIAVISLDVCVNTLPRTAKSGFESSVPFPKTRAQIPILLHRLATKRRIS